MGVLLFNNTLGAKISTLQQWTTNSVLHYSNRIIFTLLRTFPVSSVKRIIPLPTSKLFIMEL